MLNVEMVLAHVYLNIKVTHTAVVGPNAYLVVIAPKIKLVSEINVLILVLELVGKMLSVML